VDIGGGGGELSLEVTEELTGGGEMVSERIGGRFGLPLFIDNIIPQPQLSPACILPAWKSGREWGNSFGKVAGRLGGATSPT